ncbi:DMT family transporter [Metallumcola ferriviriculae]|uniref:DMT family transporter n=1 Tax=Metallumcola ferriviriculae TaxID=3039180 RepID=A0AAU0UQE7_9FIRM|nr:DMT family transporter [Desulfitibacteraceae bacterium MK1]
MTSAYMLILLAAVAWGSLGIAGENLFKLGLLPTQIVWFRSTIAFAGILLLTMTANRSRLRIKRHDIPFFLAYGLISVALFYLSYLTAIEKTGVAAAAILLYTAPAITAILSRMIYKEPIDKLKLICIALTISGCFLVVKGYDLNNLKLNTSGILWGLMAGLTYALYPIFGKHVADKYHPWTIILYSQGIGSLFLSTMFFPKTIITETQHPMTWVYLLYIGIIPTLFSYLCYNAALKHVAPGRASIIATLEPVAAVFFAYVFLGQLLEPVQMAGAFLVVVAVIIVQLPKKFTFLKQ